MLFIFASLHTHTSTQDRLQSAYRCVKIQNWQRRAGERGRRGVVWRAYDLMCITVLHSDNINMRKTQHVHSIIQMSEGDTMPRISPHCTLLTRQLMYTFWACQKQFSLSRHLSSVRVGLQQMRYLWKLIWNMITGIITTQTTQQWRLCSCLHAFSSPFVWVCGIISDCRDYLVCDEKVREKNGRERGANQGKRAIEHG